MHFSNETMDEVDDIIKLQGMARQYAILLLTVVSVGYGQSTPNYSKESLAKVQVTESAIACGPNLTRKMAIN